MQTKALTFEKGRRCLKCGAPIADQIHGNQKHCEDVFYEDGTVQSCKAERDAERKKASLDLHREPNAFQQQMRFALESLLKKAGPLVSLEQLDLCGIRLDRALRHEPKGDRLFNFYFTGFRLEQLSLKQFKIHPHVHPL